MRELEQPHVVGSPPQLASRRCDELLCEQYWYRGRLDAPFNVIHFRFASEWHRLTFDTPTVFWRVQSARPEPYAMPEIEAEVRLDDLGVRLGLAGQTLTSFQMRCVPGGAEVEFQFAGGQILVFRNVADQTSLEHTLRSA